MIRHVIVCQLSTEDAAERREQLAELRRRFEALPAQIPEMHDARFGEDTGGFDGNWDFVLLIDFDDEPAVGRYLVHPAHQDFVGYLTPIRAARAAVDFAL